jgi:hypothetical protein
MAQIHWTHKGNGNWTTASDWSSGTVPGASDDVFIGNGVTAVTVTSDSNVTVNSIGTNTHSTLDIGGMSTFTATNGTGSSENLGTIRIFGDSTLDISAGTFADYGAVILGASGMYNTILIDNVVQLEGGGTIEMAPSSYRSHGISGNLSKPNQLSQLDNVDCDIAGDGYIGDLYFDNQANGILETNSRLGAGTLELIETNIQGQGFENEGRVFADDGGTLELFGAVGSPGFFNFGTIFMNSVGDRTVLEIKDDVILKGGGNVILSNNFNNDIQTDGLAATLENVDNTISGSGLVYDANLTLINDAGGKIEADYANSPLIIYTGGNVMTNAGLLEAVNGATLEIQSAVNNSGTVAANGGNATFVGNLSGTGKAEVFSGSQMELMGSANQAAVVFENNTTDTGVLMLDHSIFGGGSADFKGTVAGLCYDGTNSDTLGLQDINFASGVTWSFTENANGNRGALTVADGNGDTARIALLGQYIAAGATVNSATSNLFHVAADSIDHTAGTLVTTSFHG